MPNERCVVITGAGAGLGRILARHLAAGGDTVVLLGRTYEKLLAAKSDLPAGARAVICDVTCAESVRSAFKKVAVWHPRIDILINNAGLYEAALVVEATDLQIEKAVMTNLAGAIYCTRSAIPLMRPGGQIVNISSETVAMNHAMFSLYQSSKAGLERFSDALRLELAPGGIRVNLVRAGAMYGEDSHPPANDPAVMQRFDQANVERGIDTRNLPMTSFESAAQVICQLTHLPADVNIPHIVLEARHS